VAIILSIVLGMIPAVALRFAMLRKPISRLAAAGTCFGILIYVGILVSTSVERKFRQRGDEPLTGPLPILTDLVSQMFYVGVPVVVGSYFTLRRGANSADADE
jgi:hypothetical protein